VDWFSNNKPGSPVPVIVEIEVGGTDYRFTDFDEVELYGWPGDRYEMKSVKVTVKADLGEDKYFPPVLSHLQLSTQEEMAWAPKVSTDAVSGLVITVWHGRGASRKVMLNSGELPLIAVGDEGVRVGRHLIGWDAGEWGDDWDQGDHIEIFWQGKPVGHELGIHEWRDELGPLAKCLPTNISFALYMAIEPLPGEQQSCILELLQELDYLIHYGDTSPIASSPEQFILAMTREPERILNLALTLPWERARYLTGSASLMLWLEENHPQSPRQMPQHAEATDGEDEWPPHRMRIACAMFAARMAGTFSQADADRMDEGPPETWPLEIWQKLGFAPPSPAATNESPMSEPSSHMEPFDETSGDLNSETQITAEVNIRASGDLYRITRDTKSDPCDGEELLVYDSVNVDVAIPPRDEDCVPLVLESVAFHSEDEDFPLPHMPPAPPHIGQVLQMRFWSHLRTNIQIADDQLPNVRITRSGVTVADHHFSWETVHEQGNLDQSDLETAYFHGVMLYGDLADLIFEFRHASSNPQKTIIRHLVNEIDFIAAHTRADGFIASPAGLVQAMNDDPDIIMQAVLAMPWDYARRICAPAEVMQWIEESHPGSLMRHTSLRQEPPSADTPPADSVEASWAELESEGYPRQDHDPGNGETFPVYPEEIFYNDEHPLSGMLPENARPETWRELDSANFNPSKARTI
jgi:hypothetical protein